MGARSLLAAVVAAVVLQSAGAMAAAPSNDAIGGAIAITALPYSQTLDTTQATTDAEDAALNTNCGAPATDASVWYKLDGTGGDLFVDVSASDYSAGVLVGVGSPGSLSIVSCGPSGTLFFAEIGQTYYILAIDDQNDGAGNGGQLQISIDTPPPAPEIVLTVDKNGRVSPKNGSATIGGTVTCTGTGVDFAELYGDVAQRAGRTIIRGFFYADFACDGATHPWSAKVTSDDGLFAGGRANVSADAFACNAFTCGEQTAYQTIRLKGGAK
jgi:hypothetical protein